MSEMSLQRLRTFVEVYRQRSISGAARTLDMTQPAVSQHVAGLETSIGRSLFERRARGVEPTAAADELAADIGSRLDEAEAALSSARARSQEMAGALHIIGHQDVMAEVVTRELIPLMAIGMRVRQQFGDARMIRDMLLEGLCDLGVSGVPISDRRLRSELLREESVMAVAAPEVAARIVAAADLGAALAAEPLVAYSHDLPLTTAWLNRNGLHAVDVQPVMLSRDMRGLREILRAGFGWAVLPEYLCAPCIARNELALLPAPVGPSHTQYYLHWLHASLRQPRVAHARQTLLWRLGGGAAP
ncbi:MAG: LysR family transcriptional regulator [Brevundimonas sp.]